MLDERPAGGRNTIQDRQRRRNKQRAIHDQNLDIASRLVARWRRYEFLYKAFQRRLRFSKMAAAVRLVGIRNCTWYNSTMSKKPPLSQTNPYLKDPAERRYWVLTTVTSSAAIEGIHLSKEELEILRNEATPTFKHVYEKSSGSRR